MTVRNIALAPIFQIKLCFLLREVSHKLKSIFPNVIPTFEICFVHATRRIRIDSNDNNNNKNSCLNFESFLQFFVWVFYFPFLMNSALELVFNN